MARKKKAQPTPSPAAQWAAPALDSRDDGDEQPEPAPAEPCSEPKEETPKFDDAGAKSLTKIPAKQRKF